MWRDYDDIQSRLGTPLWYDGNGAPRYVPFTPDRCGIYDQFIAFMKIGCQNCDQTWMVAVECRETSIRPGFPDRDQNTVGWFHYGDPPRHMYDQESECSGVTMNSIPIEIVEFWSKKDGWDFSWERTPKYEWVFKKGDE